MIKNVCLLSIFAAINICSSQTRQTRFSHPGQEQGRFGGRFSPYDKEKFKKVPIVKTAEEAIKLLDDMNIIIKENVKTYKEFKDFTLYFKNVIKEASKFESSPDVKAKIESTATDIQKVEDDAKNRIEKLTKGFEKLYAQNITSMSEEQYKNWNKEVTKEDYKAISDFFGAETPDIVKKLKQKALSEAISRKSTIYNFLLEEATWYAENPTDSIQWISQVKDLLNQVDGIFINFDKKDAVSDVFYYLAQQLIEIENKKSTGKFLLPYEFWKEEKAKKFKTHEVTMREEPSRGEQKLIDKASLLVSESVDVSDALKYSAWSGQAESVLGKAQELHQKKSINMPKVFRELYDRYVINEKAANSSTTKSFEFFEKQGEPNEPSEKEQKLIQKASNLEKLDISKYSDSEYTYWSQDVNNLLNKAELVYEKSNNIPNIFHELYKKLETANKDKKILTPLYKFLE